MKKSIFKAYDIRGKYPSEIDGKIAFRIGRAIVEFLGKKSPNIVVGRDNRLSSPILSKKLKQGILIQGGNVIDISLATTPLLYFSVFHKKYDGGVSVTASHNSSCYNGFKIVREKAIPIGGKTGLKQIKELTIKGKFKRTLKGKEFKKEFLKDYAEFNRSSFNFGEMKPFKIVIDTANAVPGIIISKVFEKTPFKIYPIFEKLIGSFPNHDPDPSIAKNLKYLQSQVKKRKADLGIAFDGDGDRIIFIDEKGFVVRADLILSLVSEILLKEKKGRKILYDIRSSNIVRETIKKNKGKAIMARVGHSFIKAKMRKENIYFGGELSGHYYFKKHYFCEAPLFVLFKVLEYLSSSEKPFSEAIKPFEKYYHSGEINFKVEDKKKKIKELEKKYKKGKISHLDGLRCDFNDWWFSVRPSNTEPFLRLVIEAKSKSLMEKKKREIKESI